MDVNVQKYQAFIKAVECGSFTKAAEQLHYTQSGISRMIADLEKDWNLPLLERNRSGVKLTSFGKTLLPYAQSICREYDKLQIKVDDLHGVQTGVIRIGTISSVAQHWLPGIIRAFQKDFPGIDYEILLGDYTEIEDWIRGGRVDCGFLRAPQSHEFETIPLKMDKLLVILPENHPLASLERVPIAALQDEPFMLLEKGAKAEISEFLERNGVHPHVHFTTWDDYAVMSMVENGLGISMVPELILKRTPYKIVAKETDVPAYRVLVLALRSKKDLPEAVRRFLDYLDYRNT